jgi:hypothetical protein
MSTLRSWRNMASKTGDDGTNNGRKRNALFLGRRCVALLSALFLSLRLSFFRKPSSDDSEYERAEDTPRATPRSGRSSERRRRGRV